MTQPTDEEKDNSACKKIKYFSKHDASYARKQFKGVGVKRYYECSHCANLGLGIVWHLTSQELRVKGGRNVNNATGLYPNEY